jgi:hypothetical protein
MTIAACPEAGVFPAQALAPGSLLKKHLTASLWHALKDLKTDSGVSLNDCIRSGLSAPDSAIGVYAGDAESIDRFGALFAPLIQDLHRGFDASRGHNGRLGTPHPEFIDPDPQGRYIRSTRMRLARNLRGVRLMPTISKSELLALEQRAQDVLGRLTADLAGSYQPVRVAGNASVGPGLDWLPGFAAPDRFHQAAGIARAWPQGRGVFSNPQRSLQIWVNEEDHLRIISVQAGSDVQAVYARLLRAHEALASMCDFQESATYGYLASCPSNLGTGLRASFHMDLPHSGRSQAFRQLCASHDMELRSASGEGGQQSGTLYDISNKRRLGLSPVQCIQQLLAASLEIIALEQMASA